jgi:hypothetical protein
MEADEDFKLTMAQLKEVGQQKLTLEERKRRRRALDDLGVPDFAEFLRQRVSASAAVALARLTPGRSLHAGPHSE